VFFGTGTRRSLLVGVSGLASAMLMRPRAAHAASARQISHDAYQALRALYAQQPKARDLGNRAKGILVFPKIYKGGFIVGGQTGDGALTVAGKTVGYYNLSAASFGLQAGGQRFSYALFLMTDAAISGPSVVVIDKGAASSFTTTTLTQDVYAFPFGQKGLMAGLGLEGSKITRIHPGA